MGRSAEGQRALRLRSDGAGGKFPIVHDRDCSQPAHQKTPVLGTPVLGRAYAERSVSAGQQPQVQESRKVVDRFGMSTLRRVWTFRRHAGRHRPSQPIGCATDLASALVAPHAHAHAQGARPRPDCLRRPGPRDPTRPGPEVRQTPGERLDARAILSRSAAQGTADRRTTRSTTSTSSMSAPRPLTTQVPGPIHRRLRPSLLPLVLSPLYTSCRSGTSVLRTRRRGPRGPRGSLGCRLEARRVGCAR